MGRSFRIGLLVALVLLAASADRAFALGLGGFLRAGGGHVEGEYDFDSGPEFDIDADPRYAGLGFVLEVHPTGQSRFSYRVDVGYEQVDAEVEFEDTSFDADFDMRGMAMDHSFGFALLRQDKVRLWIGPQARLGLYGGDDGFDGDLFVAEFGIGGVFGANFKVTDGFLISTTAGLRITGFAGTNEYDSEEDEFAAGGGSAFFNVAFMGLTGDDR